MSSFNIIVYLVDHTYIVDHNLNKFGYNWFLNNNYQVHVFDLSKLKVKKSENKSFKLEKTNYNFIDSYKSLDFYLSKYDRQKTLFFKIISVDMRIDYKVSALLHSRNFIVIKQKLGQIPGSGGSARLQKMVGITRTKDIVMRSRRIKGQQAYEWGVATECVPDVELTNAVAKLVDELRAFSPMAQRTAKKMLNETEDCLLTTAIEVEGHCYSRLRNSEDFKEGVEAFHGKRQPKFVGR